MSAPEAPRRSLPASPSIEHLRKQAKRLAKSETLKLAEAQRRLAHEYGFRNWAELLAAASPKRSPLADAAARADVDMVRALLASGANVDGEAGDADRPLFLACDGDQSAERRLQVATMLLDAGAFPRYAGRDGATAMHAAARRGPLALVELLAKRGALFWQGDDDGRLPYDYALAGQPIDREQILFLSSDGPKFDDPDFRAAVVAIQTGDAEALEAVLDARPTLLRERAKQPEAVPKGYFTDPRLFWFVANNPTLIPEAAANIVEIARLMIARGVVQNDLDYALGLTMSSGGMSTERQIDLAKALVDAGAIVSPETWLVALGHEMRDVVHALVRHGLKPTAPVIAGLGLLPGLGSQLQRVPDEEKAAALAMAVINHQLEPTRICLAFGADPNRFMPVHAHATPLHQAALSGDIEIMKALIEFGARTDIADTMWRGTPLGWAMHGKQAEAEAYLRSLDKA